MDCFILTNTEFFRQISNGENHGDFTVTYRDFINAVFELCAGMSNRCNLLFVMTYTETGLQSLYECYRFEFDKNKKLDTCLVFIRKALLFIRHTVKMIQTQVPLLAATNNTSKEISNSKYQWTGSSVDLVELIYGFTEMKSINNGETPITELAGFISSQFGVEIKDCYSAYVDIKHRKNNSRTYYLDKMRERLNRRMQLDDERERVWK